MYSPKIHPNLVYKLSQIKQKEKLPITWLANAAIMVYIEKWEKTNGKLSSIK